MKNYEIKAWAFWLSFLMAATLLISCKSKQTTVENNEVQKHFRFERDETLLNVTKVNPSENNFAFPLPGINTGKPECDSVCQQKMDELLANINISQKNGKNEMQLYYDKYNRIMYLNNKLAGTIDSISKHTKIIKEYYNITKKKTITITKTTNILNIEQKFNIWTGRLFWIVLFVFAAVKIRKDLYN